MGIDAVGLQFFRKIFVVLAQELGIGSVVVSDHDGVVFDSQIAFDASEEVVGEVKAIPLAEGFSEALAQLVNGGLGEQSHGHLSVADVEVEGSSALPAESLIEFEELLDMPALGIGDGEILDFIAIGRGQERLVVIVLWALSAALNESIARLAGAAVAHVEGSFGSRIASPSGMEGIRLEVLAAGSGRWGWHGHEQIEGGFFADLVDEFGAVVFAVGHYEGALICRGVEDALAERKQIGSGLGHGRGRGSERKTNRLGTFRIQTEEALGHLFGSFTGVEAMPARLAFGEAFDAMRIDGEKARREMATGAADLAESNLQALRIGDAVSCEQLVDGCIGGNERQAVGKFEAFLAQGTVAADAIDAEGRFVNQMHGHSRSESIACALAPGAKQIPCAQAQMLGRQKPDADLIAGDFVGEQLANLPLDARRVAWLEALLAPGTLGLDVLRWSFRTKSVQFFFASRNR